MLRAAKLLVLTCVFAAAVVCHGQDAEQDQRLVTVTVASGRVFTARIDGRSDENRLWLRFETGSIRLLRPIDWTEVVAARLDSEPLALASLREMAARVAAAPSTLWRRSAPPATPADASAESEISQAEWARQALGTVPHVVSVDFDARLANWDGDIDADGLLLQLYPIDVQGNLAAAGGTLEVELIAPKRRDFNEVPHSRGSQATRIARWSEYLSVEDFGANGAEVRLPFQAIDPEFDTSVGTHGLVHVRFAAPGHGVFERSQEVVRIRRFAPLRDLQELKGELRYFSTEATSRGRQ